MKFSTGKVCFFILLIYLVFSFYAAYNVFFKTKIKPRVHRVDTSRVGRFGQRHGPLPAREEANWNPWEEEEWQELLEQQRRREAFRKYQEKLAWSKPQRHRVQILGKAAIGLYLWEHILEGALYPPDPKAQWREGEVVSGKISFSFYTGPTVVQGRIPADTESVILVLNGREEAKVSYATQWLEYTGALVQAGGAQKVGVVLLGNERCANRWLRPYMRRHGGFVDLLFLVYDSPWVNGVDVLQWPLGVATYRDFPVVRPDSLLVNADRPYLCNFLGTTYRNSSRETLMRILKKGWERECLTIARDRWQPIERVESQQQYGAALAQSDLTLCPVGMNLESYRIYEACSLGCSHTRCSREPAAPLRLLKAHAAPSSTSAIGRMCQPCCSRRKAEAWQKEWRRKKDEVISLSHTQTKGASYMKRSTCVIDVRNYGIRLHGDVRTQTFRVEEREEDDLFVVMPCEGTIDVGETCEIMVSLCSPTVKKHKRLLTFHCALASGEMGPQVSSLRVKAKCISPDVQLSTTSLTFAA